MTELSYELFIGVCGGINQKSKPILIKKSQVKRKKSVVSWVG